MALVVRLARKGRKKRPFYSIVVAESSSKRDGRPVCRVGFYDPLLQNGTKVKISDPETLQKYVSHGAKPFGLMKRYVELKKKAVKQTGRAKRISEATK